MTEWMVQVQLLANRSIATLERRADASRGCHAARRTAARPGAGGSARRAHAAAALMVRGPWAAARAALLLSACLGVATAFFRLGAKGLWGDEVWEVSWAQQQPLAQTFLRFHAPPIWA